MHQADPRSNGSTLSKSSNPCSVGHPTNRSKHVEISNNSHLFYLPKTSNNSFCWVTCLDQAVNILCIFGCVCLPKLFHDLQSLKLLPVGGQMAERKRDTNLKLSQRLRAAAADHRDGDVISVVRTGADARRTSAARRLQRPATPSTARLTGLPRFQLTVIRGG